MRLWQTVILWVESTEREEFRTLIGILQNCKRLYARSTVLCLKEFLFVLILSLAIHFHVFPKNTGCFEKPLLSDDIQLNKDKAVKWPTLLYCRLCERTQECTEAKVFQSLINIFDFRHLESIEKETFFWIDQQIWISVRRKQYLQLWLFHLPLTTLTDNPILRREHRKGVQWRKNKPFCSVD